MHRECLLTDRCGNTLISACIGCELVGNKALVGFEVLKPRAVGSTATSMNKILNEFVITGTAH